MEADEEVATARRVNTTKRLRVSIGRMNERQIERNNVGGSEIVVKNELNWWVLGGVYRKSAGMDNL